MAGLDAFSDMSGRTTGGVLLFSDTDKDFLSADLFFVEHGFYFVPNIYKESPEKPAFIITKYMD